MRGPSRCKGHRGALSVHQSLAQQCSLSAVLLDVSLQGKTVAAALALGWLGHLLQGNVSMHFEDSGVL